MSRPFFEDVERTGAERVAEAGRHAVAPLFEFGLARDHLRRRCPCWPCLLVLNDAATGPGKTLAPDTDAVANGAIAGQGEEQNTLAGVDDDSAGPFAGPVLADMAQIGGIYDLPEVDGGYGEPLVRHRAIELKVGLIVGGAQPAKRGKRRGRRQSGHSGGCAEEKLPARETGACDHCWCLVLSNGRMRLARSVKLVKGRRMPAR